MFHHRTTVAYKAKLPVCLDPKFNTRFNIFIIQEYILQLYTWYDIYGIYAQYGSGKGYRRNFEEANGGPLDGRRLRRTLLGPRVAL